MSGQPLPVPPAGTLPVTVPGNLLLVQTPQLVVWAGEILVFPAGFTFTMLMLFDPAQAGPPADFAITPEERGHLSWLTLHYPSLSLQPRLRLLSSAAHHTLGRHSSRWYATPLPAEGPAELAIHLNGTAQPSGAARLDSGALARAAARTTVSWPG